MLARIFPERQSDFMRRFQCAVVTGVFLMSLGGWVKAADDKDPKPILDKAIKALGGEEKLAKIKAASWKAGGKLSIMGEDNPFTAETTVDGMDHFRQELDGEFMGNKAKIVAVLAGDKGWRSFAGMEMEMDKDAIASQKRNIYLTMIPVTVLPLKGKDFKVELVGEDKVDGKAVSVLKAVGSDGKDFTIAFEKESGLPVKLVAKVAGFMGDEVTQESTYSNYKDFEGVKKATKIESKRDGAPFMVQEITEFKAMDKADPKKFEKP
jgi:hypothetical protein